MTARVLSSDQQWLAYHFAHVALPDLATDCEPWEWRCNDGVWTRLFTVEEWQVGAVLVAVAGEQTHTGKVRYWAYVGGEDQFTHADLDRLSEVLQQAQDLIRFLEANDELFQRVAESRPLGRSQDPAVN